VPLHLPDPRPDDLADLDEDLCIDLLPDSLVVQGVSQIMADARRHGVGSPLLRPPSSAAFG